MPQKKFFPSVDDVQQFFPEGPYKTKSGGNLFKLFELTPEQTRQHFLSNSAADPEGIRGFCRSYMIPNLLKGGIGGMEFHKIRGEIVVCLNGEFSWILEDVYGQKRTLILTAGWSFVMPPFIMHTYKALEDGSGLLVVANTAFDVNRPETRDTYSAVEFEMLREIADEF